MCRIEAVLVAAQVARPAAATAIPDSSETFEAFDPTEDTDIADWQTVPAKRKGAKAKAVAGPVGVIAPAEIDVSRCDGNAVDLYYDQKELFHRGWQSGAKQPRSVKQKKRTEYQVSKRRDQSTRDRARMVVGEMEDDGDF